MASDKKSSSPVTEVWESHKSTILRTILLIGALNWGYMCVVLFTGWNTTMSCPITDLVYEAYHLISSYVSLPSAVDVVLLQKIVYLLVGIAAVLTIYLEYVKS